jgi:DNA-binding transcriptional ArsR family regulator
LRALAAEVDVISGAGMRLEILALLATGEKSVSEITAAIEASQPGVSHHLTLLKTGGYVTNRRDGKFVFYTLDKAKCVDRLTKLAGVLGLSGGTLAGG